MNENVDLRASAESPLPASRGEGSGRILLAAPRGYCAGVDRAVDVVEKALELYGAPVYVRKEIVHNKFVVESLTKRGAIFVQETDEVPEGTFGEAPDHIQVVGTPDEVDSVVVRDPSRVVWISQTTLSVDETRETVDRLRQRFPQLIDPPSDDICYATQNRQGAVKHIAPQVDVMVVVGSANSSNSVRLRRVRARDPRA